MGRPACRSIGQQTPDFPETGVRYLFDGSDVVCTAALGGDVRISTVDGDVLYTVAPGTQTDTKVRLRGKGVPTLRNKQVRGDHYVTLVVQVPTKLTKEQKDLLEKFDESMTGEKKSSDESSEKEEKSGRKKFFGKDK